MKIHNPNDLEFDPQTLRALARGELDPVRQAVEDHRQNKKAAKDKKRKQEQKKEQASGNLPAARSGSAPPGRKTGKPSLQKTQSKPPVSRKNDIEDTPPKKTREQREAEYRELADKQNQLTEIIRECEALEVMNYDLLAMKMYPDGVSVVAAKRRRDLWLLCCLLCLGVVLMGWVGSLPPWAAGIGLGFLVLLMSLIITPFRKVIYTLPTFTDLKSTRKGMEFKALNHIKMLEGSHGLVYQCQMMLPYRTALRDKRYQRLVFLSQQGKLIKAIRSVAGIRLYLSYLLEAQQAFAIVKQEYMKASSKIKKEYSDIALQKA